MDKPTNIVDRLHAKFKYFLTKATGLTPISFEPVIFNVAQEPPTLAALEYARHNIEIAVAVERRKRKKTAKLRTLMLVLCPILAVSMWFAMAFPVSPVDNETLATPSLGLASLGFLFALIIAATLGVVAVASEIKQLLESSLDQESDVMRIQGLTKPIVPRAHEVQVQMAEAACQLNPECDAYRLKIVTQNRLMTLGDVEAIMDFWRYSRDAQRDKKNLLEATRAMMRLTSPDVLAMPA